MENKDEIRASEDDLRILVDGKEVPRWIGGAPGTKGRLYIGLPISLEEQESEMSLEIIGGFADNSYRFVVDGYRVPYLKAVKIGETEHAWSGDWNIVLDDRFSVIMNTDQIENLMWFVANAMAISAGYTCHGPNSVLRNLFGPPVKYLDVPNEVAVNFQVNADVDRETIHRLIQQHLDPKPQNTLEGEFQHFLSYSGMSDEAEDVIEKMRKAFFARWM